MTPVEAVQLCRLVKACCPSQVFDEFTPTVWAEVLDGYSYADAKAVVMKLVATPVEFGRAGYIEPRHIIGGIHRLRAQRLDNTALPTPPADLEPDAYIDWVRAQRAAIASGATPDPTPVHATKPDQIAAILRNSQPAQLEPTAAEATTSTYDETAIQAERLRQQHALAERITQEATHGDA